MAIITFGFFAQGFGSATADLVITEVMSTSGAPGNLAGLDWWELTNNGFASVSLTGYEWEDNNPTGPGVSTAIFPAASIGAGESIIIHQGDTTLLPTIDAEFRTAWSLPGSVQVLFQNSFGGNNPFSGLSSGGDEVNLYNNLGQLIGSVSFPASTSGFSFEWDAKGADLGLSVDGENGAYTSSYGGVASPGFTVGSVPEPSSITLLGLAGLAVTLVRRNGRQSSTGRC